MKKRMMALLVCILLLAMMIPGVAQARGNNAPRAAITARVVRYSDAQFKILERMVATANRQIEIAVKFAQLTPWNDVPWLLAYVDSIVANVFAYANSIGAVVVCEYTTYYIDGQYVLIDPLRVIPL
ncbi:MAG TPA: hypothetical protein DCY10_08565 [Clostridiales bacterium]|jgi:hypothetical protein|nr:hypothetical protein [Clostridiales bacterium]